MEDIVVTLVFMMALLMFSIYPAIKIVAFVASKKEISSRVQNFLTLFFAILLALIAAIFLKVS